MALSVKDKIFSKIKQKKRGWTFSAYDFVEKFKRRDIDESLASLSKEGKIRRIMRGVYDYPLYSQLLSREIAPDINRVAHALERKFNWNIYPDGNTALNFLGLSTQVVSKYLYVSDGESRRYVIDGITLQFEHKALKEIALNGNKDAVLLIQAIRARGENHVDDDFIETVIPQFTPAQWKRIRKDASTSAAWIYDIIKRTSTIASQENE